MTRGIATLVVSLVPALLLAPRADAPAAAERCLDVREQRAAIRSGDAVRPAIVRRSVGGEVLRLRLCIDDGGLVWRVVVLSSKGRVSDHRVNARTGALMR